MNANLTETAMIANLSISQWTARKYDKGVSKKVEDEYNAHDAGRFNKILVAKEAINEIQKVASETRIFHYANTLPWSDNGDRILPAMNFYDYSDGIRERHEKFDEVVHKFIQSYPELKEDAKIRLNGMFKELDYPNVEEIKTKFNYIISFSPVPDSKDFRVSLKDDVIDKIKKEIDDRRTLLETNAMKDLWKRVYDTINHMIERLKDEKSIFRDSLISNVADICQLLPKLNIGNDENLIQMGKEIENKLLGVEPETLRKDKGTRKEICGTAEDILNKMKGYLG